MCYGSLFITKAEIEEKRNECVAVIGMYDRAIERCRDKILLCPNLMDIDEQSDLINMYVKRKEEYEMVLKILSEELRIMEETGNEYIKIKNGYGADNSIEKEDEEC